MNSLDVHYLNAFCMCINTLEPDIMQQKLLIKIGLSLTAKSWALGVNFRHILSYCVWLHQRILFFSNSPIFNWISNE